MLLTTTHLRTPKLSVFLLAATAMAFAAPASAGRSNPAPIIFKSGAPIETNSVAQSSSIVPGYKQVASKQSVRQPVQTSGDRKSKRIEFRYPDQPSTVYDRAGGNYTASADPIVFSSAKAAISPAEARQYASIEAPQMSVAKTAHDPAITKGGFDARATAKRIATQNDYVDISDAPLAALAPTPAVMATSQPVLPTTMATLDKTVLTVVYGDEFVGYPTANGEIYTHAAMTAAHPDLPLPSLVHISNPANGQEVVVRVNDRGPFESGAGLQVSKKVAQTLGLSETGQGQTTMRYLGAAPAVMTNTSAPAIQPMLASYQPTDTFEQDLYKPATTVAQPLAPEPAAFRAPASLNDGSTEQYFIQVGSFSDIGNAQELSRKLGSHTPVNIIPARVNGADFFRVHVGPVSSRQAAQELRNDLDMQGIAYGRIIAGQ